MKLNNQWYDSLKFISQIFLPALATLVGTLGVAFGYPEVTGLVVTVITAIATFIGSMLGLSSINYYKEDEHNG